MSLEQILDTADIVIPNTDEYPYEQWLERRREGIGGSDAAAALGLSKWDTPYSVWAQKVGLLGPKEDTNPMVWGRRLEIPIGLGFAEDTEIPVTRYPVMLRSKEFPFMQVNVDFLTRGADAVVECKNVGIYMADEWEDGNVPDHYMLQGQHELAVTGLEKVWFAVLVGGNDPRYIEVERDQDVIDMLVEQEAAFWDLVQRLDPPSLDGDDATTDALKAQYADPEIGSVKALDDTNVLELIAEHARLNEQLTLVKRAKTGVDNDLKALLGNYEVGTVNGTPVVTWKKQDRKEHMVKATSFRKLDFPKGAK